MGYCIRRLLLVAAMLPTSAAFAQNIADNHGMLLALSKHDHSLALIDPATLQVKAKVPVGDDPHEVIASTDGKTAYVSNYGFGALHTITTVDLVHAKALLSIDVSPFDGPHGLAFAQDKLWFTSEVAKAVVRFDPATNKIDMVVGTGQNRIHLLYVSPDAQHLVASNVTSGTMSLIDEEPVHVTAGPASAKYKDRKDWNQTVVKVGNGSEGFDVSPDGREVWVANAADATVSVIDRMAKQVVAALQSHTPGGNRLKFTRDGRYVLVSAGTEIVVLDAHARTEVKRIPSGKGLAGIFMDPNGKRAFVASGADGYLAIVDLATLTITGRIDVGGEPDGMAWAAGL